MSQSPERESLPEKRPRTPRMAASQPAARGDASSDDSGFEALRIENDELRRRLAEAEDTLRALRAGEADAVVGGLDADHVLTLDPFDKPYKLLVDQMSEGAATLTEDGQIIHCNRRFADLLRQTPPSLDGRPFSELVAPESREEVAEMLRRAREGEAVADVALRIGDTTSAPIHLRVRSFCEGALGTCLVLTDVTEQRRFQELQRAQAALRASEERLDLAQQAGRIGTFEWNIRTGEVAWSRMKEELFGIAEGSFGGRIEDWRATVFPEDLPRVDAALKEAVEERGELDVEFRIRRPDGETQWISTKARVFHDEHGEPLRMLGVSMDVTEEKRAEQALREADRNKDTFLATLAHELRNPLAPIRNAVHILNAMCPRQPDLDWSRGVLDRQVRLMARLLDDLLDVSRIASNKLELRKERIDLKVVLDASLETSKPWIEAGKHELTIDYPREPIPLNADAMRLTQVFSNLLNNAAKYTDEGGRIHIAVERRGDDVAIAVRDTGMGIPHESLPHLFEIFTQGKAALVRAQGGIGIGLSLVKGLVGLHGGSVEARSEGPGRGSEFVVSLPVASDAPAKADESHGAEPAAKGPRARRILIADDNHDSADSLAMLMRLMGNDVVTAYDGEQAVEAAQRLKPDVVLLDLGMPRLSGFEACSRIRKLEGGSKPIVIALTGWGQEDDRRRSEEAGFDEHMIKPVDPNALVRLLAALSADRVDDRTDGATAN